MKMEGMPYGRNQGQGQGHSKEVDRQSPTGLILSSVTYFCMRIVYLADANLALNVCRAMPCDLTFVVL